MMSLGLHTFQNTWKPMIAQVLSKRPYEMTARMISDYLLDNREQFPSRNTDGSIRINSTRSWRNFPIVQTLTSRLKADPDFVCLAEGHSTKLWAYIGDEQ